MSQDRQPDESELLLPWHVNATLSTEQRAQVERWLAQRPTAHEQVAFWQDVACAMRMEHLHYDEAGSLAQLRARVAPQPQPRIERATQAAVRPWTRWLVAAFEPKFAFAMLMIAVQGLIIGVLLHPAEPQFAPTRSIAPVGSPTLYRVTFAPSAGERELRLLLVSAHMHIAYGPTQLGDYYLVCNSAAEVGEKLLRQNELVQSVTKVDRLPTSGD